MAVGEGHVVVWRTHALTEGAHAEVERAIVMIHGTGRNAQDYFRWALAAAVAAGRLERTAVVAPHFKARSTDGRGDEVEEREWFWSNEGWKAGEAARNGAPSSFEVIDQLVEQLNNSTHFPNLKQVVVAGHSAGGQFVQRYAVLNRVEGRARLRMRYVVANPSSYMYLDELRLRAGATCTPKGGCSGEFRPYWDAANCTTYNHYRYGPEQLPAYAAGLSSEQLRARYVKREVTYLAGELDTRTDDASLDRACPAMAQGTQRRERAITFWNYMQMQLKADHAFAIAPGCGHSAVCVFAGPAGTAALFGE
jgi:pimeloyl-ACP methyl ester carboxylesterase